MLSQEIFLLQQWKLGTVYLWLNKDLSESKCWLWRTSLRVGSTDPEWNQSAVVGCNDVVVKDVPQADDAQVFVDQVYPGLVR